MKLQSYGGAGSPCRKQTHHVPSWGDCSSQLEGPMLTDDAPARSRGWLEQGLSRGTEPWSGACPPRRGGRWGWAWLLGSRAKPSSHPRSRGLGPGVVRKPKIRWFDPKIWHVFFRSLAPLTLQRSEAGVCAPSAATPALPAAPCTDKSPPGMMFLAPNSTHF